jgi:hypothetical protein
VTPAAGGAQMCRGRGRPKGPRAQAARPAPARAPPKWRRPAQRLLSNPCSANRSVASGRVRESSRRPRTTSTAADASSCFAQRSSSLPASIAGELDLGEGHPRFDLLVAGWLRALPHPRAASSSRLTPSARVAIATLLATPPPRLSLSEHGQRAREAEVGEPDSHYLLVAIQVTAAVDAGRQSVWVKVARFEFAVQWRS